MDGVEQVRESASLRDVGRASFRAPERSQAVEVLAKRKRGGDIFLTSCLLSQDGKRKVVELEGGQRLFFHVQYAEDESGDGTYEINIRYQETKLPRKIAHAWRRQGYSDRPRWKRASTSPWVLVPTGVVALVALLALTRVINFLPNRFTIKTPDAVVTVGTHPDAKNHSAFNDQPVPAVSPETNGDRETSERQQPPDESHDGQGAEIAHDDRLPRTASVPHLGTPKGRRSSRDIASRDGHERVLKSVAPVKTVYVEKPAIFENAGLNLDAYAEVIEQLKQSKLFRVVEDPEAAQARLVMVSGHRSALVEKVRPQLVTAKGRKVIWNGPIIPLFDEYETQDAQRKAEDVGRTITEALIQKKESELSLKRP